MSKKNSNVPKMGSVPKSVSVKTTPVLTSGGGQSMPAGANRNPMDKISSKSMGMTGGTTC